MSDVTTMVPEPFVGLLPGTVLEVGDIRCRLGTNDWDSVSSSLFGKKTDEGRYAYARLGVLEGYVQKGPLETLAAGDYVWLERDPHWVLVDEESGLIGMATQSLPGKNYACTPDGGARKADENIPARHRRLFVGEVTRRGDKVRDELRPWANEWVEIRPCTYGMLVAKATAPIIRPVHPDSQSWYVDMRPDGKGSDEQGTGSAQFPYKTLEHAVKDIEAAHQRVGKVPYGIIWDLRGVPLMAYDLPEPEPEPEPEPKPAKTEATIVTERHSSDGTIVAPKGYRLLRKGEYIRDGDVYLSENNTSWIPVTVGLGQKIRANRTPIARKKIEEDAKAPAQKPEEAQYTTLLRMAADTGQRPEEIVETAHKGLPAEFRMMVLDEELRSDDLMWQPVPGYEHHRMLAWQPVPKDLQGTAILIEGVYLFARRTVPVVLKLPPAEVESRLRQIEQAGKALLDLIAAFRRDLGMEK